eukprot:3647368-Prymnesium_polylepis.4
MSSTIDLRACQKLTSIQSSTNSGQARVNPSWMTNSAEYTCFSPVDADDMSKGWSPTEKSDAVRKKPTDVAYSESNRKKSRLAPSRDMSREAHCSAFPPEIFCSNALMPAKVISRALPQCTNSV